MADPRLVDPRMGAMSMRTPLELLALLRDNAIEGNIAMAVADAPETSQNYAGEPIAQPDLMAAVGPPEGSQDRILAAESEETDAPAKPKRQRGRRNGAYTVSPDGTVDALATPPGVPEGQVPMPAEPQELSALENRVLFTNQRLYGCQLREIAAEHEFKEAKRDRKEAEEDQQMAVQGWGRAKWAAAWQDRNATLPEEDAPSD